MMATQAVKMGIRIVVRDWLLKMVCLLGCISAHAVTLEEAIESAIKNDSALRVSKLNLLATEENVIINRSRFFPQISLQGSSSQLTQTTIQDLPTGGSLNRSFTGPSVNHQLVLRQALIRPKELSLLRIAELQTAYMALKYKYDVHNLKYKVTIAWIELLATQQIVQLNERPLSYMQASMNQERAKFEHGDSTRDAVMEVEAQYENVKATHMQAVAALKARQNGFEKLTKLPATPFLDKKLSIEPVRIFFDDEKMKIWTNLREQSLEIQMSKLQELMQLEKVRIAEADHKPTLDLLASVNFAQNDATSTQGFQYKNKQLGVQYSVPLYSGGGISAATRQANLSFEAGRLETEVLTVKLENDFENNWSQIVSTATRQKALFDSYLSALEQLKATRRGLDLGVKSISDLASNELTISRRMMDLVNNTQEYLKSILKIQQFNALN